MTGVTQVHADFRSLFVDLYQEHVNIDAALGEHALYGCPLGSRKTFAISESHGSTTGARRKGDMGVESERGIGLH